MCVHAWSEMSVLILMWFPLHNVFNRSPDPSNFTAEGHNMCCFCQQGLGVSDLLFFLPPQWNYLRWLRRRRHFIWWWSMPAAVSQPVFTPASFTHAHCGFTHAVNKSRISPSDQFPNVGVRLGFKQGVGVDGGGARLLLMYDCVSLGLLQLCVPSAPKVLQEFGLRSYRDWTKQPNLVQPPTPPWNVFKRTHCHEGRIIGHANI